MIKTILRIYLTILLLRVPLAALIFNGSFASTIFFGSFDILFFLFSVMSMCKVGKARIRLEALLKRNKFYVCFFILALFSAMYSTSDQLGYGVALLLRDLIQFVSIIIVMSILGSRLSLKIFTKAVLLALIIYPLIFIFTADYSHDFTGSQGRLMYEGYKDANVMTRDIGLLLVVSFWMLKEKIYSSKTFLLIGVFLSFIGIVLSFSKTTTIAILVSCLFSYALYKTKTSKKIKTTLSAMLLFLCVFCLRYDYIHQYIYNVQGGSAITTMSGRTLIWEIAKEGILKHLYFGSGLHSFRVASNVLVNNPGQAHNEMLNILYSYGLVGLFLVCLVYLSIIKAAVKCKNIHRRRLSISCVLFFLIVGFTEGQYCDFNYSILAYCYFDCSQFSDL